MSKIKTYVYDWRNWARGLVGALIGGGANAITVMVVDPSNFNLSSTGWKKLAGFTAISSLVSAALYLKQHPVPDHETTIIDKSDCNPV